MFAVTNLTRQTLPGLNFAQMAGHILGEKYDLSLVFVGRKRSQRINRIYRHKNYPANILSFPLEDAAGEIVINLKQVALEAGQEQQSGQEYLLKIFIHGLLHLKGLTHGSKMELLESQLANFFQSHGQNHRHRSRHRQRVRTRGGL